MKFSLADPGDGYTIHAYSSTELVVGEKHFHSSIILVPDHIISDWSPRTPDELQTADFEILLGLNPDLALLGTGARQRFPPHPTYRCLTGAGIGLEIMTTAAACRTYNILVSEGRRVAAALIL
ncbi:MAG: Mth938-like domain-containing protein [Gammaproteobacteria bacterium]|nr:Mth938-like domain-containing protein [Gammaproteobacteria bacterium]